ncbi:hypothetical protein QQF64_034633 [Cirrhinus molitorella]|uniref:Uncharacterized protein n=1 Tax=Cirrhinus molitorella TaxID=172907 RepID=A0ABR3L0V0_9TELE
MKDRQTLFSVVKDMLYAREMSKLELLYQQALTIPLNNRNRKFQTYLQTLYSRRESWALSYRGDLPTCGNQTNNYVEVAMRVLKDKILCSGWGEEISGEILQFWAYLYSGHGVGALHLSS